MLPRTSSHLLIDSRLFTNNFPFVCISPSASLQRQHLLEWVRAMIAVTLGVPVSGALPPVYMQEATDNAWSQISEHAWHGAHAGVMGAWRCRGAHGGAMHVGWSIMHGRHCAWGGPRRGSCCAWGLPPGMGHVISCHPMAMNRGAMGGVTHSTASPSPPPSCIFVQHPPLPPPTHHPRTSTPLSHVASPACLPASSLPALPAVGHPTVSPEPYTRETSHPLVRCQPPIPAHPTTTTTIF